MDSAKKIHEGTFTKKDGTERRMRFYRLKGLTAEDRQSLGIPAASERPAPNVGPGSEVVWDIDAQGFRVFNWGTQVQQPE